ncbi:hypothetical protein GA0070621_5299 [Micromonospora narathiwatensis]|uniref:DNA-directed RNA polymerase specialized sigma subunit, sigma24 family n=2 Tax=Micromonospora narathiwatensis TaxID=299146 RepID=A0A1A9ADK2_9ACTN|nr:hypothetical protein GA0070621_5299 [Micromonospora narathiwatensis]
MPARLPALEMSWQGNGVPGELAAEHQFDGHVEADASDDDTDLPGGVTTLPALRDWLLAHPRAYTTRDTVWRDLILRARLDGPAWVVAAAGMALPALRRCAGQLRTGWSGDAHDNASEILTGFLTSLRDRTDLSKPAPYASLCMAAWRAGYQLRQRAGEAVPVDDVQHVIGPRTPTVPYGHPDLLVQRAVGLGLLDPCDEQPYIDLRLGRRAIEPIAAAMGITVDALRMRTRRIDQRIAHALASGLLTGVASPQAAAYLAASATHRKRTRAARAAAGARPTTAAPAGVAA